MRTMYTLGRQFELAVITASGLVLAAHGQRWSWAGDASARPGGTGAAALVVAAEPILSDGATVGVGGVLIADNGIADNAASRPGATLIHVRSLEGQSLELPRGKVVSLQACGPVAATGGGSGASIDDEIPPLIRRQPQVVQDAWRQIAGAVVENQRLPRPRPEPVFARAELWMMVGNYDAALRDLLEAMRLASDGGAAPRMYATVFNRLREVLERYDVTPVPPEDGEPSRHYGHGVHAFWAGRYAEAEQALTNAIALAPGNPLYWFMRAVTRRRLGNDVAANHDVLLGVAAERRACLRRDEVSLDINRELKRLQGDDRIWLEDHRRGNPSRRTMSGMQR